jgi:hypothetical protein
MFAWSLILGSWIALLSLILHDATKDDRNAAALKKSRRRGGRVSATIPELELAITEAVKKAGPECDGFIGVVLQQTAPKSRLDVNWQLRGVKFGTANRTIASKALTTIIERMDREYYVTEN